MLRIFTGSIGVCSSGTDVPVAGARDGYPGQSKGYKLLFYMSIVALFLYYKISESIYCINDLIIIYDRIIFNKDYAGLIEFNRDWRSILSPTVFYKGKYRFFFFSREEEKIHVHVTCAEGEAKFWLEPIVTLEKSYQLSPKELNTIQKIIEDNKDEVKRSWKEHFER
jgi:hypothetical protein